MAAVLKKSGKDKKRQPKVDSCVPWSDNYTVYKMSSLIDNCTIYYYYRCMRTLIVCSTKLILDIIIISFMLYNYSRIIKTCFSTYGPGTCIVIYY